MGREIRRVPPNWKHPTMEGKPGSLQPMNDQTWEQAVAEWKQGYAEWEAGTHKYYNSEFEFWEGWSGPPDDRAYYRPWSDEEATWFQVWQTVSEGYPITPPFATLDELIEHLATKGTDWDLKDMHGRANPSPGWGRPAAEAFARSGHAFSMMIDNGKLIESKDIPLHLEQNRE